MPKIMLVEDDNNLREIYGERLMAEGYEIVSAGDGEEALALAVKEKPDLIISDVMMPKISGFDMLDILRQTPETKFTKVIMMTALSQTEDKDRADRLGADKYLVKSQVTLEDVARVVHDLIYGAEESAPGEAPAETTATESTPAVEPTVVASSVVTAPEPQLETAEAAVATEPIVAPEEPVAETPAPAAETPATESTPAVEPAPEVVSAPVTTESVPVEPSVVTPELTTEPTVTAAPSIEEPVETTEEPVAASLASTQVIEPTVTSAAVGNTPEPSVVNPISGSDTHTAPSSDISASQVTNSATPQSSAEEEAAIAQQIDNFVASNIPAAPAHESPLVEPSQQDLIHAQNAVEDPSVIKPTLPGATVPPVSPEADSALEPASARKKVIQPLNDVTGQPNINELYEQEMAQEAANSPIANAQFVAAPAQLPDNPISNVAAGAAPELETIDASAIEGLSLGDQQPPIPPAPPEIHAAISGTPTPAAEEEKAPDPNDPASFAL